MENCSAVVAGHICLDIIPGMSHVPEGKLPSLLQPGHLVITGPATFSTGGPVSNTGLALHLLGVPTRLIAKVGVDPLAGIIRKIVAGYDPSLVDGIIDDPGSTTSYSVILSAPGVDRIFLHCPGANDTFCSNDIDYPLVAQARLFHFGYPPVMRRIYSNQGEELVALYKKAKATGVTTSLDMTYPDPAAEGGRADWPGILRDTLPYVDVFLPSFEELLFMLRREQSDALQKSSPDGNVLYGLTPELLSNLGEQLIEMGVKMAVIKLGNRGLYLRTAAVERVSAMGRGAPADPRAWAGQEMWSSCYEVEVVGTTGSGDATIAGFLSGLLRGLGPAQTVTAAVAVGACNVESADALSGLCSWEDTLQRVAAGWERKPLNLVKQGWTELDKGLWKKDSGGE